MCTARTWATGILAAACALGLDQSSPPTHPPPTNSLLGTVHLLLHLPVPCHHVWQAGHPGEITSQMGDSRSLEKSTPVLRAQNGAVPQSPQGRPRTLTGYQLPCPLTCPSAHCPSGLQALPRHPDARQAVAPRASPGPTSPGGLPPLLLTQAPSSPATPLPRRPAARSKTNKLHGGGTNHLLLPPFGPLSPESAGSLSCLPRFLLSLPDS